MKKFQSFTKYANTTYGPAPKGYEYTPLVGYSGIYLQKPCLPDEISTESVKEKYSRHMEEIGQTPDGFVFRNYKLLYQEEWYIVEQKLAENLDQLFLTRESIMNVILSIVHEAEYE